MKSGMRCFLSLAFLSLSRFLVSLCRSVYSLKASKLQLSFVTDSQIHASFQEEDVYINFAVRSAKRLFPITSENLH